MASSSVSSLLTRANRTLKALNDVMSMADDAQALGAIKAAGNVKAWKPNNTKTRLARQVPMGPYKSMRIMRTTGRLKKFRKPRKRVKKDDGMLNGSVRKYETGGSVDNIVHCVYVGHSTCMRQLEHKTMWEAIFRQLLRSLGVEVTHLDQSFSLSMTVFYYDSADASQTDRQSITIDGDGGATGTPSPASFEGICTGCADRLYSVLKPHPDFYIDTISLRVDEGFSTVRQASMRPSQAYVTVRKMNRLRIQNQTTASREDSIESKTFSTDVENNPLVGKVYASNHGGFLPADRPITPLANWKGFTPNAFGMIGAVDTTGNVTNEPDDPVSTFPVQVGRQLDKPPNPNYFKFAVKHNSVKVDPGIIKTSVLYETKRMSLHKWFMQQRRLIAEYGLFLLNDSNDRSFQYNGKARLFALEKALDSRVLGNPAPINIGWQIENRVSTSISYRKKQVLPERVQDELATTGQGPGRD
ncbi:MAG: putative capsid protein [Circoviridae sp.]|nr:MAG: putative capsid protein [Circoviridae sp.]